MDLFIRRTTEFYLLYNCSFYNVNIIPIEQRQNIFLGLSFFTIGTLQFLLYIPCIVAIWKHMENPCYKMMFYVGVLDMACLPICAIGTGIFGLMGAVYCSHPNTIYVLGALGFSLWVVESSVESILAINRCIELCSPHYADVFFRGWRTWAWMLPPTLYGVYTACETKPLLFSGQHFSWFFNPHLGYFDHLGYNYENPVQEVHNWIVVVLLSGAYLVFGVILFVKTHSFRWVRSGGEGAGTQNSNSFSQKMIFLQVALISAINVFTAILYLYMQYNDVNEFLIILASFGWVQIHGIPSLIYLAMNKTIRRDCGDILLKLLFGINRQQMMLSRIPKSHLRLDSSPQRGKVVGVGEKEFTPWVVTNATVSFPPTVGE